jgi:hypothetical protein
MKLLSRLRKRQQVPRFDANDELWGGWNYPEPIISNGDSTWDPGGDGYLKHLIYMAEYGWHYCQKAIVGMEIIYPLTDYRPAIDDEFRKTFNARMKREDDNVADPMTLTLYERDGKLIMSNDWETYWMYRERQDINATCIIIGRFTDRPDIAVLEKPFMIYKAPALRGDLKDLA